MVERIPYAANFVQVVIPRVFVGGPLHEHMGDECIFGREPISHGKRRIVCHMLRPGIGYIRLGNFGATTYDEFMEGMRRLEKQGMRSLVLDLQDNGGGYLQAAVDIAGELLRKGDLIVYTEGRQFPRANYKARAKGDFFDVDVYVLVNEFTASAAEIVSGAVQDHDRGVIIGRRTFGKGLVQRPIGLPDGSMIRLTIAHYYTPSGRCIQKPYTKGDLDAYANDFENRLSTAS